MGCHGNHAFNYSQNKLLAWDIFLHTCGLNEQFDTHGNMSLGSNVGQIRSHGTSNMILFPIFSNFSSFVAFFHPQNYHFPTDFLRTFFMKQDTILIIKLLITVLRGLIMGQGSFSA